MKKDKRFQRNSDFIYRKIVDEAVLVPIHQDVVKMDSIFTLNDVGAFLWEKLENPITFMDLNAELLKEYDVSPEEAESDIEGFLEEMISINAINEVP